MINWKVIGMLAMSFAGVALVIRLLIPTTVSSSFDSRFQSIENRLERLERMLGGRQGDSRASKAVPGKSLTENTPAIGSNGISAGSVEKTSKKPPRLEHGMSGPGAESFVSESLLSNVKNYAAPPTAAFPADDQADTAASDGKMSRQKLDDFFSSLSPDKHDQAEKLFKWHMDTLKTSLDEAAKQGYSPQELSTLVYEDQVKVQEEMKSILSEKEYESFIKASPKIPKSH